MKKNIFRSVAIAATATLMLASCDQSTPKMDAKAETPATPSDLKIAYVEVDSIMSQYKFCKDYSLILQKKEQLEEQYSKITLISDSGVNVCFPLLRQYLSMTNPFDGSTSEIK